MHPSGGHHHHHHPCMPSWVDHLVDSVCDDTCSLEKHPYLMRMGATDSTTIHTSYRLPPHSNVDGPPHFARLHDQFLDSLLHEQVVLAQQQQQQRKVPPPLDILHRSTSNGGEQSSCAGHSTQSKDSWTTVHPPTIVLRSSGHHHHHHSSSFTSAASSCCSESTSGHTAPSTSTSCNNSCGGGTNHIPHIATTGRKRRRGPNLRVQRRKASPSALRQTKKKSANHFNHFATTNSSRSSHNNTPSSSKLETIRLEDFSTTPTSPTTTTSEPTAVTSPFDHHQGHHRSSPHEYLHPHCRIQKDKGKGDPIGSKICGKTAETTLSKLRAKMLLLTEHCQTTTSTTTGSGHSGHASSSSSNNTNNNNNMKRRPALVSKWSLEPGGGGVCETRSILTLKMGFLSMTYGILLRWDVTRSHQITLVVLRKNCHESFYKVSSMPSSTAAPASTTNNGSLSSLWFPPVSAAERRIAADAPTAPPSPPPVPRQRRSETRVTVLYAVGLNKKVHHDHNHLHRWTVQMNLGDETEHVLLSPPNKKNNNNDDDGFDHEYKNDTGSSCGGLHDDGPATILMPRSNCNATIIMSSDGYNDDVNELVLQLFEHRRQTKVLRCTLRIPTASLLVVPEQPQQHFESTQLRVPVPGNGGYLQLEATVREWETTTTTSLSERVYDNDLSSSSALLYPPPRLVGSRSSSYDDEDLAEHEQYQHRHDCGGWEYLLCLVC